MSSVSLGPLALPLGMLLLAVAFGAAASVGRFAGRGARVGVVSELADMLIVGALASRAAFVARWHAPYAEAPWSVLDIRDGGFEPWAGVAAALLVAAWHAWRRPALRLPLAAALAAGGVAATGTHSAMQLLEPSAARQMPPRELAALDGSPATLAALAAGKPLVLNLWATWCPPCRREMPVLAAAQRATPQAVFVFANQGEDPAAIRRYLDSERLTLANVVLDPDGHLGRDTRSAGLPTTLFYDRTGRLVEAHMGPLSPASLGARLASLGVESLPASRRSSQ